MFYRAEFIYTTGSLRGTACESTILAIKASRYVFERNENETRRVVFRAREGGGGGRINRATISKEKVNETTMCTSMRREHDDVVLSRRNYRFARFNGRHFLDEIRRANPDKISSVNTFERKRDLLDPIRI